MMPLLLLRPAAVCRAALVAATPRHPSRGCSDHRSLSSLRLDAQPLAQGEELSLLDPAEKWPVLPRPTSFSPSSISEYLACPQSFLFQYVFGIKQPTSLALLKGRLCHTALEQLYDLSPIDRTEQALHNLFRRAYGEVRQEHLHLFEGASEAEARWGREGLELLSAYWRTEDATCVQPARRELWVSAHLDVPPTDSPSSNSTFLVRGIVDRLDVVRGSSPHASPHYDDYYDDRIDPVVLEVVDYKTSQPPNLKYTKAVNERIRNQAFFQLQIYALLLHEQQMQRQRKWQQEADHEHRSSSGSPPPPPSLPVRFLRLLYLKQSPDTTTRSTTTNAWTLDLGATESQRSQALQGTRTALQDAYRSLSNLLDLQDPTAFVGCRRSFCYCHVCRPRFVPGTVWEP